MEKLNLQSQIVTKILKFPDKIEDTKELQKLFGLLNYSRKFIPNLSILVRLLHNKLSKNGQKYFNSEGIKLIQKIKRIVQNIQPLGLLKDNYYKIL